MWIGLFLVCVGTLVLLNNLGIIQGDVWDYVWPLLLILLGISLLFKRSRHRHERWIDNRQDRPLDKSGDQ
jgi:hypothetical protein